MRTHRSGIACRKRSAIFYSPRVRESGARHRVDDAAITAALTKWQGRRFHSARGRRHYAPISCRWPTPGQKHRSGVLFNCQRLEISAAAVARTLDRHKPSISRIVIDPHKANFAINLFFVSVAQRDGYIACGAARNLIICGARSRALCGSAQ